MGKKNWGKKIFYYFLNVHKNNSIFDFHTIDLKNHFFFEYKHGMNIDIIISIYNHKIYSEINSKS